MNDAVAFKLALFVHFSNHSFSSHFTKIDYMIELILLNTQGSRHGTELLRCFR